MLKTILLVGAGGFAGTIARYLLYRAVQLAFPLLVFPIATFGVNVAGSFTIGILFALSDTQTLISPELRLILATGFCGGFTTFSAFAYENFSYIKTGNVSLFIFYSGMSIVLGLTAVYLGYRLGRMI